MDTITDAEKVFLVFHATCESFIIFNTHRLLTLTPNTRRPGRDWGLQHMYAYFIGPFIDKSTH